MAGLYIHIPFCKQACFYCNFHFSTSLKLKESLIDSLCKELQLRSAEYNNIDFHTVYFGGGTPSLLSAEDFEKIWQAIDANYSISPDSEITLEANPDDLDQAKLDILKSNRINRLSIGVQSFYDADLEYMNRAHNAAEALSCLEQAKGVGIHNISIDLIYGTPTLTDDHWRANLGKLLEFDIPHLSAYQLTVEPKTPLEAMISRGKTVGPVDDSAVGQFKILMEWARNHKYDHYEISNLAKSGFRSKHNSRYWSGAKYLGVGPSAHSFNGKVRRWNLAHNPKYIAAISSGIDPVDGTEILSERDFYNEFVMTSLRLDSGVSEESLSRFPQLYNAAFKEAIAEHVNAGMVRHTANRYTLSDEGKVFADRIASDCFVT